MEVIGRITNILEQYQSALSARAEKSAGLSALESARAAVRSTVDFDAAYVLDLSNAAQQVLAQRNNNNTFGISGPLSLTEGQVRRLEAVLSAYQNAPVNEETSAAIYVDLKAAGLLPSQIASSYETRSYNTDTIALDLLGSESRNNPLDERTTFSTLLGDRSILTKNSSQQLADTLLRYGEINPENRSVLLDNKVNAYLDLFDQGGIVA